MRHRRTRHGVVPSRPGRWVRRCVSTFRCWRSRLSPGNTGAAEHMPFAADGGLGLWRRHWPEYAMEAALLGSFMVSACLFSVVLFYPEWPVAHYLPDPFARRVLMG